MSPKRAKRANELPYIPLVHFSGEFQGFIIKLSM